MIVSKVFESRKGTKNVPLLTICETHRCIYDLLVLNLQDRPELLEKVFPLLERACAYGVNMTHKLVKYKLATEEEIISHLPASSTESIRLRKERIRLVALEKELATERLALGKDKEHV